MEHSSNRYMYFKPIIKSKIVLLLTKLLFCVNIDCGSHVYMCGLATLSTGSLCDAMASWLRIRFLQGMASLLQLTTYCLTHVLM